MLLENLIIGVENTPRSRFEGFVKKLRAVTEAFERRGTGGIFRVVLIISIENLLENLQDKLETATTFIVHRYSWERLAGLTSFGVIKYGTHTEHELCVLFLDINRKRLPCTRTSPKFLGRRKWYP